METAFLSLQRLPCIYSCLLPLKLRVASCTDSFSPCVSTMTGVAAPMRLTLDKKKQSMSKLQEDDMESLAPTTTGGIKSSTASSSAWADLSALDAGKRDADSGGESEDSVKGLGATTVASNDRRTAKSRTSAARSSGSKKKKLEKLMAQFVPLTKLVDGR